MRDYKLLLNPFSVRGGTGFLSKASLDFTVLSAEASGRIGPVSIVNVYAPSGNTYARERKLFFRNELVRYLSGLKRLVMLGDLNAVDRVEDRIENGTHSGRPDPDLKNLIASYDLTYSWLKVRGMSHHQGRTSELDRYLEQDDMRPCSKQHKKLDAPPEGSFRQPVCPQSWIARS